MIAIWVPKTLFLMVQRELTTLGISANYGHVFQAKGGTGASPSTHPTLETNKQTRSKCPHFSCIIFCLQLCSGELTTS